MSDFQRLTSGPRVSVVSLLDPEPPESVLLNKSVKRKIRYHVQSWPASRLPGFPSSHSWIPGFRRLTRDSRVDPDLAVKKIRKTENPLPRAEAAGCRLRLPGSRQPPVTTSPPEPKFFVKFILGPEPDSRIRRKKLHTGHRSSQNRFFENLYKSFFPS